MFEKIFASTEQFCAFLSQVRLGKQEHSYLIVSKDSVSANEMATLFAKALLCKDMCGVCENCKKVQLKAHPDVKYYPEGGKLLVDDSKKIVDESFTKPIFANIKVFIINSVDNSTEEAQNKLLKSLEEPNECVYYILTTSNLEKVLPTIRSRCHKVELNQLPQSEIAKLLDDGEETNKALALSLGGGYISKTLQLNEKENLSNLVNLALSLLKELNSSKEAIGYVKSVLDTKTDFPLLLEIMTIIIEDAIMLKADIKANIRLEMFRTELESISKQLSLKCLSAMNGVITKANKELVYNVGLPLVVDGLVMNILEVKYLCK